jgi:mevalonate kinase
VTDRIGSSLSSHEFASFVPNVFARVVATVVGWVGSHVRRLVLHRASADEPPVLRDIAKIAVACVEQTKLGEESEAKLADAMRVAQAQLDNYGIQVSVEQLQAIIEAAVYADIAKLELPEPAAEAT